MARIIIKALVGAVVGAMLFASAGGRVGHCLLGMVWGVGIVYGVRFYLAWLSGAMNASLKLSVISWLSFGTGLLGFLLLMAVLAFVLSMGWLYGWYLLVRDVIAAL